MGRARWAVMVVDKRQRSEHKAVGVVHWWESGGESARLEEERGGVVRTMGWTKVRRIIFAMMRCATIAKAADDRPCSIAGRIGLTPPRVMVVHPDLLDAAAGRAYGGPSPCASDDPPGRRKRC